MIVNLKKFQTKVIENSKEIQKGYILKISKTFYIRRNNNKSQFS